METSDAKRLGLIADVALRLMERERGFIDHPGMAEVLVKEAARMVDAVHDATMRLAATTKGGA